MNSTTIPNASMMTVSDELNDTLPDDDGDDSGGGSLATCEYSLYYIKLVTLAIAMSMMITTLILIPCHRRLRKQHHVFPYNLVLSDLSGAVVFACFEGFVHGYEPPYEAYMFLVILLASSNMVSLLSIALVTGYQFITIRVDPFGSRNIITTPRLIITCLITWGISFACASPIARIDDNKLFVVLISLSWSSTILTGFCYLLIYRSIARVPCGGNITADRKEQNQRVLRTFGLVYSTTVICWICPWVTWTLQSVYPGYENPCLINAADIMININWIANSIIYWWRLKEFRSMFASCSRKRGAVDPQMSLVTSKSGSRTEYM